ncbi:hypothetical protein FEM33_19930 [Dyadobacter flavalbus]|uniref:Uncharacterized protein n=1 Tax=Dyadobacter flavalbus TaxID=2579942 RepID=A0A5M8QPS9_9BACT|nr:hypothetical protein [Dyadobacter flavalbus]KAA6436994.1 hypothetical protein FEM33_19930 [Dyadobacter flavalbus]
MRVVMYVIAGMFLWIHSGMAQKPVNKSGELWAVWEEAEKKLEAGQFDNAIVLYRAYEPSFSYRLKQAEGLKKLYIEGQRLQKAGKYPEAINVYKKHRSFEGVGSLTAFDTKIDECIAQMAGSNNSGTKDFERRILASELAYKGQKKLRDLDTLGAERDYSMAKKYGGNFSATLKEQYEEGLKITKELREWGRKYRMSKSQKLSLEQEKELLESYRRIKGVPVINTVETKTKEIIAKIEGSNSMLSYAQNCETDLLLNYISQNQSQLAYSQSLVSTLSQYKSIQYKIGMLKSSAENSRTVKSAYYSIDSMVRSIKELPEDVKASLEECIRNDKTRTFEAYADQARKSGNVSVARKYEAIAQGQEVNIDAAPAPCAGAPAFNRGIIIVREHLKACKPSEAKRIWDNISRQLGNCEQKNDILESYQSLQDSIHQMSADARTLEGYLADAKKLTQDKKFEDARLKYQQMAALDVCNVTERDQEVRRGLAEIKSREIRPMYRIGLTGSVGTNKPAYSNKRLSYGLVTTGGIDASFIDHHNPIDVVAGAEYFNSFYYALDNEAYTTARYKLEGVSLSLAVKLHLSNTNPNKIRPYIKIGREEIIPVNYEFENYATSVIVKDRKQLKKTVSSIIGGFGLEMQRKHFGFFIEGSLNYGIGGLYNKSIANQNINTTTPSGAYFRRAAGRFGFRFW